MMQNHHCPTFIQSMVLAYLSGASAVILLLQVLLLLLARKLHTRRLEGSQSMSTQETGLNDLVSEHRDVSTERFALEQGGRVIYGYKCARFIGCLALWGLSVETSLPRAKEDSHDLRHQLCSSAMQCHQFALCVTTGYTSLLGFISITARSRWSKPASTHLSILLLAVFAIFVSRDLFPLATFTTQPEDIGEGWLLWAKIIILAIVSVVLPLVTPRQYTPFDPTDPAKSPHPEQTASWLSMLLYTWEDPIVYLAYKSPHLSHEQLPPMADQDYSKNLVKKSFVHLDPFSGSKRHHLFIGLMKVYRLEYTIMALMTCVQAFTNLASPVGLKYLLEYIETDGKGAIIRPWIWIAWLFFGPMANSISFQWYIFLATRTLVRTEGTIIQLVFSHSLRIRMKAEGPDDKKQVSDANVTSSLDTTLIAGSDSPDVQVSTDEGTEDTLRASEASSLAKGKQKAAQIKKVGDERGPESNTRNLIGKINNFVSSDLNNITEGRYFLMLCLYVPLEISLSVWILYGILGWSALVGLATIVVLSPIPGYVARKFQTVQIEKMKKTDARVQTVTETMNVLRMIKLFGWEPKMDKKITEKREEELGWVWKQKILEIANNNLNFVIPLFTMLSTYATYTIVMGQSLSAAKVFSSISIFDILRGQLFQVFSMIPRMVQAKVSLDRLNNFLLETELLDEFSKPEQEERFFTQREDLSDTIGFRNAVFSWSDDTNSALTPSKRRFTLNIGEELFFERGHINLIVGPTGSGKTSVLMALLGEMHFIPSDPTSWYGLPRKQGVAYAAQESWVQNETIRDNILFGAPHDEERYQKVLYQCALERDLALFETGDQTEVGEKGLTLSGGQKARVTLARAIYSSSQILLLDDILAALDVHTSKWIVNKCLAGDLVQGRTVLLVTHNVAMASSVAHFMVSLGANGRVVSHGSISEVIDQDDKLAAEMAKDQEIVDRESETVEAGDALVKTDVKADGKLVVAEEILVGTVSWPAFKLYLVGLGGNYPLLFSIIFVSLIGLTGLVNAIQTWFLGYWASQYTLQPASEVKVPFYLSVYALLLIFGCVLYSTGYILYIYGTMRASRKIHRRLIQSVLGTTLRWLDITPTSRVITRCTQDMQAIDKELPQCIGLMVELTVAILIRLGAIVLMTPAFLLPGMIVGVVGGFVGRTYMKAQLSVKREMSNAKAPVLGHFGAAITGLTSVRAYGAQETFKQESLTRIDRYIKCARMFYNLNRWLSIRLDVISALFTSSLAAYLVYGNSALNASDIGFSLSMAIVFSSLILWWVRALNDVEVSGNSLERLDGYIKIEQEPKPTEGGQPPAYWPSSGDLRVENLSARYSSDGPRVLHDLSFHVASGERVGIVGRTGSGKSSLTLSLLRCIATEGNIYYDGIPTSSINLEILRSNITIIPQVPELLTGTLRQNLDPFDQHDDATLNNALRSAGLFELHNDDDGGRLTLESGVASGGRNLSVGQRQILALARAMVRGSKLLILDEATSAIDYKTDTLIQSSLRNELKDVTQIIVAHRLQTIMDADKIMVLDAGKLVEFGSPAELLENDKGMLRALVDDSADKGALYEMAAGKQV